MTQTQKQWTVTGSKGFESLSYATDAQVPTLGDDDVLVKCACYAMWRIRAIVVAFR